MRIFASFFFLGKMSVFNDLKRPWKTRGESRIDTSRASGSIQRSWCPGWVLKGFISKMTCVMIWQIGKTTPKIEVLSIICVVRCFFEGRFNQRWEFKKLCFFFCWNLLFLPCRWMGLLTLVTTKSMMRWCLLIVPDCWTFPTGSVFLSGIWWFRFLQLDFFFARAVCAWKLLFEQQRVLEFLRSISLRDFEITCVMWLGYQLGSKTDPFWCVHNFGIF